MDIAKIEDKIDRTVAAATAVSMSLGGVQFQSMAEIFEMAKMMAIAGTAVPKHLRGNPGSCLAICIQALEWCMSPFAVANKSYEVNDRIAYEAQLIIAVINTRAPLKERLRYVYEGEGVEMKCTVFGLLKGERTPLEYESPQIKNIKVKNSPLWSSDSRQQLGFYSGRAWARRHCPETILGIYGEDEMRDSEVIDVTATPTVGDRLREKKAKPSGEGFNTPKITQQMSEVVPDKIIERETVRTENRAAKGEDSVRVAPPADLPRESASDDEALRIMQEAQSGSVAGNNAQPAEIPNRTTPAAEAKPKRVTKPKAEPAKEVAVPSAKDAAVGEALARGRRLLINQKTDEDISDLGFSITDELKEAGAPQAVIDAWREDCDTRRAGVKL